MSIFSDNITSNTPLQEFYDTIHLWIESIFPDLWKHYHGDFSMISSAYNAELGTPSTKKLFKNHNMYHAWLSCQPVACVDSKCNGIVSKVLITILYSEDETIYVYDQSKVFLKMSIPISDLPIL